MFSILRPYIFGLDPEVAHDLAIKSLKLNIIPKNFFQVDKEEILETNSTVVTIEAASVSSWIKYKGNNGISLGIDDFGESAPYKEVYNHFNLTSGKIVSLIQKKLRK